MYSVWSKAGRSLVRILSFLLSFGMCVYAFSLFFVDSTRMHDGPVMAVLLFLVALPIGYFGVYGFPLINIGFMEQNWKDVRNGLGLTGGVCVWGGASTLAGPHLGMTDTYWVVAGTAFGFLLVFAACRVHMKYSGE